MGALGMKLRRASGGIDKRIVHWCPGCKEAHSIRIAGPSPMWTFNEDAVKPTFTPSVRVFVTEDEDEDGNPVTPYERTLCHYFITDGQIIFCGDSAHELAGKTIDLPKWPYAPGTYGGIEE